MHPARFRSCRVNRIPWYVSSFRYETDTRMVRKGQGDSCHGPDLPRLAVRIVVRKRCTVPAHPQIARLCSRVPQPYRKGYRPMLRYLQDLLYLLLDGAAECTHDLETDTQILGHE